MRDRQAAAVLVVDEEEEHLARAHQAEAPVVAERPALKGLVVGVAGDLVVAVDELRVAFDDRGDLGEDVLAVLLEGVAARVEEHVAGERDHHAVAADVDREAEAGERVELAAEHLEARLDGFELTGAGFVLGERLLHLGHRRVHVRELLVALGEVDAHALEIVLERGDARLGGFELLDGLVMLALEIRVLLELRLPLLFGVPATRGEEREGRQGDQHRKGRKASHWFLRVGT